MTVLLGGTQLTLTFDTVGLLDVGDLQPGACDGLPGACDGLPGACDGLPGASDGLPGASDGLLSASDGLLSASDGLLSAGDGLPGACKVFRLGAGFSLNASHYRGNGRSFGATNTGCDVRIGGGKTATYVWVAAIRTEPLPLPTAAEQ